MVMCIVGLPLCAFGLFAMYKARQQERKEREEELQAQKQ